MKKVLSILLALVMLLSIFTVIPVSVSAGEVDLANTGIESTGNAKFDAFISDSRWKHGISWSYGQKQKLSPYKSESCCAYVADFVKYCYNKDNPETGGTYFTGTSNIQAGDILYCYGSYSSLFTIHSSLKKPCSEEQDFFS